MVAVILLFVCGKQCLELSVLAGSVGLSLADPGSPSGPKYHVGQMT